MKILSRILRWGLISILFWVMSFSFDNTWAQESGIGSNVWIEIKEMKLYEKLGRNVIEIIGASNLPPRTVLEMTLTSEIIALNSAMTREEIVTSKYIELDGQRRFDDVLSDFTRKLPPAVYSIELGVANRQRANVKKTIPKAILGKTITQQRLLIGDLKDLIDYIREKNQQFKKAIKTLTSISNDLGKWVDIYNALEKREDFRKTYKEEFTAWQVGISPKMNRIVEQVAAYTVGSLPYLYRVANLEIIRISGILRNQESILTGLISEQHIPQGDTQISQPPKTEIPKKALGEIDDILIRDAVFSLLMVARYQAEGLDLTFEKLKDQKDQKITWDKYQTAYQSLLDELTKYTEKFQSSLDVAEEKLAIFNPMFAQFGAYQGLLKQKAEALSALMAGPEEADEIENLNQTVTETRKKMQKVFDQLKDKLAGQSEVQPENQPEDQPE